MLTPLLLLLWPTQAPAAPPLTSAECPGVIIPMYGNVPRMWRRLTEAPPRDTIAIANLGNGPGRAREPEMAAMFARARAAGIRVIGYVYTRYGHRRMAVVKRDIDRWERWYPVDGIFVDNLTSVGGTLDYYRAVSAHIRSKPGDFIVMNGWATREYMDLTDVIIPFEGPLAAFKTFRNPAWAQDFDASRFANLVYGVRGSAAMRAVLDEGARRNLGTLYVTDRPGRHPYFSLPSYLRGRDDYLAERGGCGAPPQPAITSALRPAASAAR